MDKNTGCVFDIQRCSVHDGPGIRTTVFLKGCRLRCRWCCNPESQRMEPELLFQPEKCIGCGACVSACPRGASLYADGRVTLLRDRCEGCGACIDGCFADARTLKGTFMTAEDVTAEALRDRAFYESSGGGVTFSGGEPLLQSAFVRQVMAECKAHGVNTAIETCGQAPWEAFENVLPYTDLFLYDVKHLDSEKHLRFTGMGNRQIQENLRRLAQEGAEIVIRVPVIPTFNMDRRVLGDIVGLAAELGVSQVDFLPYHRYASGKYALLGRSYWRPGVERAESEEVAALAEEVRRQGVRISVGG